MSSSDHKRVVIITGASRGLCKEIAFKFDKTDDRVIVNYVSPAQDAVPGHLL